LKTKDRDLAERVGFAPSGDERSEAPDSNYRWLLKTKNLAHFSFRTIRQIRSKALIETRIEHADSSVHACYGLARAPHLEAP
jgi:hypothetical protein